MLANTLVFSNNGLNLQSDLVKIYQQLNAKRIGLSQKMIFVQLLKTIDDFELLSQSQPTIFDQDNDGLFEILQSIEDNKSIFNCEIIFNSLEEIKDYYCLAKFQNNSYLKMQNKEYLASKGTIESQALQIQQKQIQKFGRAFCTQQQQLICQFNTINLDVDFVAAVDEKNVNNTTVEIEQSILINIEQSSSETSTAIQNHAQFSPIIEQIDKKFVKLTRILDKTSTQGIPAQKIKSEAQQAVFQERQQSRYNHKNTKQVRRIKNKQKVIKSILTRFANNFFF